MREEMRSEGGGVRMEKSGVRLKDLARCGKSVIIEQKLTTRGGSLYRPQICTRLIFSTQVNYNTNFGYLEKNR